MSITTSTPSSEKSAYFDAQSNFNMSAPPAQDIDKPIVDNAPTDLAREPTIAGAGTNSHTNAEHDLPNGNVEESEPVHLHPNGSEGWLPASDLDGAPPPTSPRSGGTIHRKNTAGRNTPSRTTSLKSRASLSRTGSPRRADSVGAASTGKKSVFTNAEGHAINGSTFINGAGTTGPNASAEADESLHQRAATAESTLTPKQKSKINKNQVKDDKRLSKVIKQEGKVERQALTIAVKELSELQSLQQEAVKREAKAHTAHTKSLAAFQKCEAEFLAARAKMETAQAQLHANAETLEITRSNAREATEIMQDKSAEVDALRTMLGVDAREREVKLGELAGKTANKNGKKGGWFN